ncbi:hypothetical protein KQI52_08275 [bacterium]|nr:hypothetical protein [bacterium]
MKKARKFTEPEAPLAFTVRMSGMLDGYEVLVHQSNTKMREEIAFLRGSSHGKDFQIVTNSSSLPHELLYNAFHMARCRYEVEVRADVGPLKILIPGKYEDYLNGYKYFKQLYAEHWEAHVTSK